jgi:uncharacterized protein
VSTRWVLVDGYSVTHQWAAFLTRKARARNLAQQRDVLVRLLQQYADHTGRHVTLVFDGGAARHQPDPDPTGPGLHVVFSPRGKTADDVIERLVAQAGHRDRILVVSSDNMVRHTVEALGANSTSAEMFEMEVEAAGRELAAAVRAHTRRR